MARLTRKLENGKYAQNYTTGDGFFVGMTEMMQKLGELEDLEEAGRLVVLPKEFDKEKFIYSNCPSYLLLEDHCHGDCKACWEAALKGGEVNG